MRDRLTPGPAVVYQLTRLADGTTYRPNQKTGFFETTGGERLQPGFKVGVGFANYSRMLLDADFRGPFLSIFVWTVMFAGLTVLFSTAIGVTLAVVLNWEALKYRTLYRTLLFLPYAVPGFISILVFKGLFNQNFGEINLMLESLFGMRPAWFSEPGLARGMLLIFDEASAIPEQIFEVAEGGLTDGEPMLFLFGNATRSHAEYEDKMKEALAKITARIADYDKLVDEAEERGERRAQADATAAAVADIVNPLQFGIEAVTIPECGRLPVEGMPRRSPETTFANPGFVAHWESLIKRIAIASTANPWQA